MYAIFFYQKKFRPLEKYLKDFDNFMFNDLNKYYVRASSNVCQRSEEQKETINRLPDLVTSLDTLSWIEGFRDESESQNRLWWHNPLDDLMISNQYSSGLVQISKEIISRSDTLQNSRIHKCHWNDQIYEHDLDSMKGVIDKMVSDMFKVSTEYVDRKTIKIEYNERLYKALDYFDIEQESFEDDLTFIIRLLVQIWKGERHTEKEFKKFSALMNTNSSPGYAVLILHVLESFRRVDRRNMASDDAYNDIVRIMNLQLDFSRQNKQILPPSDLLSTCSKYGVRK